MKLTWYDGSVRPDVVKETHREGRIAESLWQRPIFIGSQGMLAVNTHQLLQADRIRRLQTPRTNDSQSIGHHAEWLNAMNGGPTTCNFDYSGA